MESPSRSDGDHSIDPGVQYAEEVCGPRHSVAGPRTSTVVSVPPR